MDYARMYTQNLSLIRQNVYPVEAGGIFTLRPGRAHHRHPYHITFDLQTIFQHLLPLENSVSVRIRFPLVMPFNWFWCSINVGGWIAFCRWEYCRHFKQAKGIRSLASWSSAFFLERICPKCCQQENCQGLYVSRHYLSHLCPQSWWWWWLFRLIVFLFWFSRHHFRFFFIRFVWKYSFFFYLIKTTILPLNAISPYREHTIRWLYVSITLLNLFQCSIWLSWRES